MTFLDSPILYLTIFNDCSELLNRTRYLIDSLKNDEQKNVDFAYLLKGIHFNLSDLARHLNNKIKDKHKIIESEFYKTLSKLNDTISHLYENTMNNDIICEEEYDFIFTRK